jgi:hypothetical protein
MISRFVVALAGVAGVALHVHGQTTIMKLLVSTDGGASWSSSVSAFPGQHLDVLVTASYQGTSSNIAGFGSAIFQPIVSNWDAAGAGTHVDRLSPFPDGGNVLGQMVNPQANSVGAGSPNPYLSSTPGINGVQVPAAPYVPGTYGRVYPAGRAYLGGVNGLTGFVHVNPPPDQLGRTYAPGTYLRIAQVVCTDWFNSTTNPGGSGVNCGQLFVQGRTSSDPDFWGNQDMVWDPGDPDNGIPPQLLNAPNGHNERRRDVQLFRFGIDLSDDGVARSMLVDAPIAGQQGYLGFYTVDPAQVTPRGFQFSTGAAAVSSATINVVPGPAGLWGLALGAVGLGRRRRG